MDHDLFITPFSSLLLILGKQLSGLNGTSNSGCTRPGPAAAAARTRPDRAEKEVDPKVIIEGGCGPARPLQWYKEERERIEEREARPSTPSAAVTVAGEREKRDREVRPGVPAAAAGKRGSLRVIQREEPRRERRGPERERGREREREREPERE
jgi:hypothetical protein